MYPLPRGLQGSHQARPTQVSAAYNHALTQLRHVEEIWIAQCPVSARQSRLAWISTIAHSHDVPAFLWGDRVDSREAFAVWVCQQHNLVNEKLGKPTFSCDLVSLEAALFLLLLLLFICGAYG